MTTPHADLRKLYELLLRPRLIEEQMLLELRRGNISKWFSGIGQEAISVGATAALNDDEYVFTLHRNLGVFTTRDVPLPRLVAQWLGRRDGFTKGRDRSFHFGTHDFHIVGMITHLGAQLPVAAGLALAHRLRKENKVCLAFCGEGATSQGDFHEALNLASVWDLPVIFLIENNAWALSTPTRDQYRCERLVDRALGYGMDGYSVDGNNVVEVQRTIAHLAEQLREKPRPMLVECETFRMRGHEEASGIDYVPKDLLDEWAQRDPIKLFEEALLRDEIVDGAWLAACRQRLQDAVAQEIGQGMQSPKCDDCSAELTDVYAPAVAVPTDPEGEETSQRFIDAVSDGLREALRRHPELVFMGQDVADYGGVFKVSEGLVEEFGKERIRNTPLCESAVLGAGLGLSVAGIKSIVEMQFADFVSCGFNQIANNLAKSHYRWGQNADVVVRMPTGIGNRAGPFHSQSTESWFAHVPGLKIVYPSTPHDAKGLLLAAIDDPNPVLFFEHKSLYRSVSGPVPDGYYSLEIGKGRVLREGRSLCIITYGLGVVWAEELLNSRPELDVTLLDLRSLLPLDYELIEHCVRQTGRVLVLHEDTLFAGIGAEIAAWIAEHCFDALDAPVMRCGSLDTPIPFADPLEDAFLAKARLGDAINLLMEY